MDANITAGVLVPISGLETVEILFEQWALEERPLYAPNWWLAEVTSVIRQYVFRGVISPEVGHGAIDDLSLLKVEAVPLDFDLLHQAMDWAERIQHPRVYDSIYLALAMRLEAEFWTADKRLVNAAHTAGASWVCWAGD